MLSNEDKAVSIKKLLTMPGWRLLKEEFNKKKQSYLDLLVDTDIETEEERGMNRKYRAMYNSIEAFFEDVKDILEELTGKEGV